MKRTYKKKKNKIHYILLVLVFMIIVGGWWVLQPENFREQKNFINSQIFKKEFEEEFYNGKALILVDCSNDEVFISKKEHSQQRPASLAKLFVIEYAASLTNLNDIVEVNHEALLKTKKGSSVANIEPKEYYINNLFAAMLVPSGNDAAYAVADYCGGLLATGKSTTEERIELFMDNLNEYLHKEGYKDTLLYDPSGFDMSALTTTKDLKVVTEHLLKNEWFRDIVCQSSYTATLPDGSTQTWKNTNVFLDPTSEYYNENVKGIKTGSLGDDYNLVVLYQKDGKEFLICSLGSESDSSRYDDVTYILKTIDESDYLFQ